jgi:hypothetical protein
MAHCDRDVQEFAGGSTEQVVRSGASIRKPEKEKARCDEKAQVFILIRAITPAARCIVMLPMTNVAKMRVPRRSGCGARRQLTLINASMFPHHLDNRGLTTMIRATFSAICGAARIGSAGEAGQRVLSSVGVIAGQSSAETYRRTWRARC